MAAPRILFRSRYHGRTDRIQMDIGDEFKKIRVGINKNRLVSSLKQVAAGDLSMWCSEGIGFA